MRLIDIGVNLANNQFRDDAPEVMERAQQAGIEAMVLTGTSVEASQEIQQLIDDLAEQQPVKLFATVGIHPHDASTYTSETSGQLLALAQHPKIVAMGETGLDFNRNYSEPKQQQIAFEAQLELAIETGLPVFMHERDAHQQQFEIIKSYRDHLTNGVIHCFTGNKTALFNYLDLDLHIGITGWVCDERRGLELQTLLPNIPLNRLMLETDAPYLLPRTIKPKPTSRRNEPAYLTWVLETIAAHRDETAELIAEATTETAITFFRLADL